MIIPVGERYQQNLVRVTKRDGQLQREPLQATLFVPMTGVAEETREVLPDPSRPQVVNGSFEEVIDTSDKPANWHYLRQVTVVSHEKSTPAGKSYLSFSNTEPGKASRALQGMALDGRGISELELSASIRGRDLEAGPTPRQRAAVIITFYDARRAVIDSERLGIWEGTFDWRHEAKKIRVPLASREGNCAAGNC